MTGSALHIHPHRGHDGPRYVQGEYLLGGNVVSRDMDLNAKARFKEWNSKQEGKTRKIHVWQYLVGLFIGLMIAYFR